MKDIYHSDNISVVVDNNVLVDLFEIGCLNLLFEVFDDVIIPQIIYDDELPETIKIELEKYDFHLGLIETEAGLTTYALLVNEVEFKKLSRYDRFAISIAKENLYYCNSNDKPVRNAFIC
jgi:predicted nucleic acid-binding protein